MNRSILVSLLSLFVLSAFIGCGGGDGPGPGGDTAGTTTGNGLASKIGVWEGVGLQGGVISWTIRITITADEQLIAYPSLSCEGFLTLLEESETRLLFRETITTSPSVCIDQGYVELTNKSADELIYNYYWNDPDGPFGESGAVGSITRVN